MEKKFITVKELSIRWRIKVATLRQWHFKGKGAAPYKISGRLLYDIEDVKKFEELSQRQLPLGLRDLG